MTAENSTVRFGLPADERIKSLKLFDQLFESGESHWQSPFRMLVVEIPYDEAFPVQVGVAVPKRKMKKAVLRNRQKRLMREAYRLQKLPLTTFCRTQKKGMAVLFVAQCNTPLTFAKTEEKIILLLRRLTKLNATPAE